MFLSAGSAWLIGGPDHTCTFTYRVPAVSYMLCYISSGFPEIALGSRYVYPPPPPFTDRELVTMVTTLNKHQKSQNLSLRLSEPEAWALSYSVILQGPGLSVLPWLWIMLTRFTSPATSSSKRGLQTITHGPWELFLKEPIVLHTSRFQAGTVQRGRCCRQTSAMSLLIDTDSNLCSIDI